jgi:hypothetical protein
VKVVLSVEDFESLLETFAIFRIPPTAQCSSRAAGRLTRAT